VLVSRAKTPVITAFIDKTLGRRRMRSLTPAELAVAWKDSAPSRCIRSLRHAPQPSSLLLIPQPKPIKDLARWTIEPPKRFLREVVRDTAVVSFRERSAQLEGGKSSNALNSVRAVDRLVVRFTAVLLVQAHPQVNKEKRYPEMTVPTGRGKVRSRWPRRYHKSSAS
jgi:hypothetical protein